MSIFGPRGNTAHDHPRAPPWARGAAANRQAAEAARTPRAPVPNLAHEPLDAESRLSPQMKIRRLTVCLT
jgi:hypothetical protein